MKARHAVLVLALILVPSLARADESVTIVRFVEPPLARRLPEGRLDARSARSRDALAAIDRLQADRLATIERTVGRPIVPVFRYRAVLDAMALRLEPAEAARVARLPGVRSVRPQGSFTLDTDAGPEWVGAPGVWDGSSIAPLPGTRGEGVVIGVLDTGINMDHASFADDPPDGYTFTNPFGAGHFVGWCDPGNPDYDPAFVCNDKLIGAWDFADALGSEADGPEDGYFHGSHTAGIAAGNALDDPRISGVAPHANLIAYDVCDGGSSCPEAAILAGIDQAVLDGVDVLNLSIEGGTAPWNDYDAALLDAVAAGVFVAVSASNHGPAAGTVRHLGPWVATVGSASDDLVTKRMTLSGSRDGTLWQLSVSGASRHRAYGPAPVVDAGDCNAAFPPGTWTLGEIVVCDFTLAENRYLLCEHVADGGGGACVLANTAAAGEFAYPEYHAIPAVHLAAPEGAALRAWLAAGSGHTAQLSDSELVLDPAFGDVVSSFSSRGPAAGLDLLKPDLVAPGDLIFSASSSAILPFLTADEFLIFSGTSMASPHVAGAAALLRALHPGWTPAEIKSAMMTTAVSSALLREDAATPADPFDRGAGRLDVGSAARAGLVLDETAAGYAAADPDLGGDPRALNLPSLADGACAGICGWQRTVETALAGSLSWTAEVSVPPGLALEVTPAAFTLDGGAPPGSPTRTLDVVVTVKSAAAVGAWQFAEVTLVPADPAVPRAHWPVAVYPTSVEPPMFADSFESGDLSAWSFAVP